MIEQVGELFLTFVGTVIIVGLVRFAWAIGGQLAQYAMSNISPSPEVTIHRGYTQTPSSLKRRRPS